MTDDELLNLPEDDFDFSPDLKAKLGIIDEIKQTETEQKTESPVGEIPHGATAVSDELTDEKASELETIAAYEPEPAFDYEKARDIYERAVLLQTRIDRLLLNKPDDGELKNAAEDFRNEELSRILSNTSVDELKTLKLGIRVSALQFAGINNIDQLRTYSCAKLRAIQGIGDINAEKIVDAVNQIVSSTRAGMRTQPYEVGTRTYSWKLIEETYHYLSLSYLYESRISPLEGQNDALKKWSREAGIFGNRLVRLLAFSEKKKQDAMLAVLELEKILATGISFAVEDCEAEIEKIQTTGQSKSWSAYEKNKEYFTDFLNGYLYSGPEIEQGYVNITGSKEKDYSEIRKKRNNQESVEITEDLQDMKKARRNRNIAILFAAIAVALFMMLSAQTKKEKETQYIELSENYLELHPGESVRINALIYPADSINQDYDLESSDEDVAVVSDGTITAANPGSAEITAVQDGKSYGRCHVEVEHIVPNAMGFASELEGKIGRTEEIGLRFVPNNSTDTDVSFTVSNSEIAVIDGNRITFLKKGKVIVTATHKTTGITTDQTVEVTPVEMESFTISLPATMTVGESVNLEAIFNPEDTTNQEIKWTSSNNTRASIKDGVLTAKKAGKVTIKAVYKATNASQSIEIEIIAK